MNIDRRESLKIIGATALTLGAAPLTSGCRVRDYCGWSSTALSFRASDWGVKGFWRKAIPGSSTPWCTMASSV